MQGEPALELLVQRGGYWLLHANHVAVWVLAAAASVLLMSRALLLLRLTPQAAAAVALPERPRLSALAAVFAAAALGSGYLAVRPDPEFYRTVAQQAMVSGNCRQAAAHLEVLLAWGHEDVRRDLATCYLVLARPAEAAAMAEAALARGGDAELDLRLLAARGRLAAGDPVGAARHLEQAAARESDPARRQALLERAAELRRLDSSR